MEQLWVHWGTPSIPTGPRGQAQGVWETLGCLEVGTKVSKPSWQGLEKGSSEARTWIQLSTHQVPFGMPLSLQLSFPMGTGLQ